MSSKPSLGNSPVAEPDLIELFVRPLHTAGARYLVAGSLGSMLYSEPRLTLDIDLAVALEDSLLESLSTLYPKPDFYCPPLEVLAAENKRECRAHFKLIHVPSGYKADFYPSQRDPFFGWAWKARREIPLPGGTVHYAPPEYVIVWKVAYHAEGGSDKHVRDIRRMREISLGEIDDTILHAELDRRGLLAAYHRLLI